MTTASALPCVSQMQPADAFMELESRDSGHRKDLELSCYFDAVSDFHLYINIMATAWGNSPFLFNSSPEKSLSAREVCNNEQLRKRLRCLD